MAYLIESSILMRLANKSDADHALARNAVFALHNRGESLRSAPQSYVEFRNSATRPADVNGLGLAPFLTFNVRHFARFAEYGPGLFVVSPNDV